MVNVRFDNLSKFKLVPKHRKKTVEKDKKLTKLINACIVKTDNVYYVNIDDETIEQQNIGKYIKDTDNILFTEGSYKIRGLGQVFSREPDVNGKHIRYIRSSQAALFDCGGTDRFVPFCPNWVCNGYLIKVDGKIMFEFNECLYKYIRQ